MIDVEATDEAPSAALLRVEELRVAYGRIEALAGISFGIETGQVVTIVGANGAGRTTLMNCLSGLLRPASGRVIFDGQDITRWPPHRIVASGIVHVPEGRAILASMSVLENLELGLFSARNGPRQQHSIEDMLKRFPLLAERLKLPAGTLSGGEQQMLAIARGLLQQPRLLLLDEPSMGLAPMLVNEIFQIVEQIHQEGTTILLVEQNARKALALADQAYVLENGQMTLSGRGSDLAQNDAVIRAYLGAVPS